MSGRTLYLSLPLCRILTQDDLKAIIGHELGHYCGVDTQFSLKFYPIYRDTCDSLTTIAHISVAVSPAVLMLRFFLKSFASAETAISRARELAADQLAAQIAGRKEMAMTLLKKHAVGRFWTSVHGAMAQALVKNESYSNVAGYLQTSWKTTFNPLRSMIWTRRKPSIQQIHILH